MARRSCASSPTTRELSKHTGLHFLSRRGKAKPLNVSRDVTSHHVQLGDQGLPGLLSNLSSYKSRVLPRSDAGNGIRPNMVCFSSLEKYDPKRCGILRLISSLAFSSLRHQVSSSKERQAAQLLLRQPYPDQARYTPHQYLLPHRLADLLKRGC